MIEVKGYASAVGSSQVNQKLSQERAQNVCDLLLQQGKVPLTRMLAPGAMGESEQVGTDKSVESQAANRRVVVRVLQNKAIAGGQQPELAGCFLDGRKLLFFSIISYLGKAGLQGTANFIGLNAFLARSSSSHRPCYGMGRCISFAACP